MNETNIKHGYSLIVREARCAILNPGAQISKAEAEFMPPGVQYWPGRRTCPFSSAGWLNFSIIFGLSDTVWQISMQFLQY